MVSVRDVDDQDENEEFEWNELSEMEEVYEEDSFNFEPIEGEKLEASHTRRIYAAEMSSNNKATMQSNTMNQEKLMEMVLAK